MNDLPENNKQILTYNTLDGFQVDALLLTCGDIKAPETLETPIIIQIHGVLGNFLAHGTPRLLPEAMYSRNISTLTPNNRMSFLGQILGWGIFDDTFIDIDTSVDVLKSHGFKNIFLLGYSLGANLAAFYIANKKDHRIKGLILEGCSFSLPDSQRNRYNRWGSIPSYENIYQRAKEVLGANPHSSKNDRIFVVYKAWGDTFSPRNTELFTYKTWWHMRGPESINAMTYKLIEEIDIPTLLIQGVDDYIVEAWEPQVLCRIASRKGNKNVKLKFIPEARHDCMENPVYTADLISSWIKEL